MFKNYGEKIIWGLPYRFIEEGNYVINFARNKSATVELNGKHYHLYQMENGNWALGMATEVPEHKKEGKKV